MDAAALGTLPALRPAPVADVEGWVHSWSAGSAVDGPGMRFVAWLTGCQMRCAYCHNPDTWKREAGRPTTAGQLLAEVARYAGMLRALEGGVTLSGGEPLTQAPFVVRVLEGLKAQGLHTALDTNGGLGGRLTDDELRLADLVLLDLKSYDVETHLRVTGRPVEPVLRFAERLAALRRPVWIRHVVVPGLTDAPENVDGLARFVAGLPNVERVELLRFHQLGRTKWAQLGRPYTLEGVQPPTPAEVARVAARFAAHGVKAHVG